jgi:hypothetical protein
MNGNDGTLTVALLMDDQFFESSKDLPIRGIGGTPRWNRGQESESAASCGGYDRVA